MQEPLANYDIRNSTLADIDGIFRLYKSATEFQKTKFIVAWPEFDRGMVENEIREDRQWKLLIDNQVACIWAIAFSDPLIWEEKNADAAMYIHRIATNPAFRGKKLVAGIVEWAKKYARENRIQFIRMDTVGDNTKLIEYYKSFGFTFLGYSKLKNTQGLPAHYNNSTVCLFELMVPEHV
ncbi:MAG TPA: GNAT family N-acetyltransferase [Bacteroidia bacterium]|nr:GNAT family N-acetyltransferase [Bacteroidia bacterium]